MAGLFVAYTTAEQALTAATARTVLQIVAPTNQRVRVKSISLTFDGTSATGEPVNIRVLRQTSAIGGTPTAVTGVRLNAGSETVQATAAQYGGSPTEPTASDVLGRYAVHPQGGVILPIPLDLPIEIPGGTRLGIEINAPANVNVTPTVHTEE